MSQQKGIFDLILDAVRELVTLEATPTRPVVINVTLDTANKEYPVGLPGGCRKFQLGPRDPTATLKVGYTKGSVNGASPPGPYRTIPPDGAYSEWDMKVPDHGIRVYVASDTATVLEVIGWS